MTTPIIQCEHLNEIEDDSDDVICSECGEHASIVMCEDCEEEFGTNCCGAGSRFE